MRFSGAKAADVLNGLLTSDIAALKPGQGQYSVALTPKGRVLADARVLALEDSFLVDVPPHAWEGWRAMIKKFVNPRLAAYRDETAELRDIGVFGPASHHLVANVAGVSGAMLGTLPAYGHVAVNVEDDVATIVSVPELTCWPGFELLVSAEAIDRWRARIAAQGVQLASADLWEVARVEAGRPEWGIDMDDTTIAQEANLETLGAMSFTKGCYTGQEVVARIHFRGHVNRSLRGLVFEGSQLPSVRSELVDRDGGAIGDVRTVVSSPRLGVIGLGMVRRELEDGAHVLARTNDGNVSATVRSLPFDCT